MSSYKKHPRTPHLPWSEGITSNDKAIRDMGILEASDVVVTLKLDGEQTSMYSDHIHARSLETDSHPSRDLVRVLHAEICYDIPEGWRICGENVYAKHAIHYRNLEAFFYIHSIWNAKNECLSFSETQEWAELLGIPMAPVLYQGPWNETLIRGLYTVFHSGDEMEGYVVRTAQGFAFKDFATHVAKFVRPGHVQPNTGHWKSQPVVPNILKSQYSSKS